MNTNKYISKPKVINIGKNNIKGLQNGIIKVSYNNGKKLIEPYNTKSNGIPYMKEKLTFEQNITFDKKSNLSLFSSLNLTENQEETNKSIKTKKIKINQLNYNKDKNKYILNSNKINRYNNNKKEKKIFNYKNQNGILLNKEIDKFKIRIDKIMKVIEDFENEYIYSTENQKIKEEFNKIIKNKKYLYNNININIKPNQKKFFYKETENDINDIQNGEKNNNNNNKTMILKNNNLNLTNNNIHNKQKNIFSSTKNIKNNNNNSMILNKNSKIGKNNNNNNNKNISNKKQLNNNTNSYNKRINYSSLIEVKSMNNEKTKKIIKENNKSNVNKNIINKSKPLTYHYPSKSNNIINKEKIYIDKKKPKEKEVINNTIYINPSYIKTGKIWKVNQKIKKNDKSKFNNNNNNKKKMIIK